MIKILMVIFLSFIVAACSLHAKEKSGKMGVIPPKTSSGLELTLRTDKKVYKQDQRVLIRLTVKNTGRQPFKHTFSSSQIYDFVVKDQTGKEVWRWSADRMFLTVLKEFKLASGMSRTYKEEWLQQDGEGKPVPSGNYQIVGVLKTKPEIVSLPAAIRIE